MFLNYFGQENIKETILNKIKTNENHWYPKILLYDTKSPMLINYSRSRQIEYCIHEMENSVAISRSHQQKDLSIQNSCDISVV